MTVVYLVLIYGFLAYLGAQDHLINVEPRRRLLIIGVTRPGSPIGCVFLFLFFFSLREVFSRNVHRQRHKLLYCRCPFEPLARCFVASVLSFAYGFFSR